MSDIRIDFTDGTTDFIVDAHWALNVSGTQLATWSEYSVPDTRPHIGPNRTKTVRDNEVMMPLANIKRWSIER